MAKKLLEKNGAEMCAALVSLAVPIKHFTEDTELIETFRECTKKGVEYKLHGIAVIYAEMTPLLFGEKHLNDIMTILSVVEGKSVKELLKMNGVDLMADAMQAWKEQISPFFQRLGLSVSTEQSSH